MIRSEYLQKIAAEDAEKIKKSGYLTLEVKNAMEQNRLAVAEYARKNNWSNVEKEHLSERVICPTDKIFIDDIKVPLHVSKNIYEEDLIGECSANFDSSAKTTFL